MQRRGAADVTVEITSERSATRSTAPEVGRIGRYVVLERIGAGGMGVVDRAYDPALHRVVALKRVRVGADASTGGSNGPQRLLVEAQAMARLNHPNVVPVYDATVDGDEVVIAMEYVPGQTLHAWLEEDRDWRSVLSIFMDAGRGLAAAHDADIVHRDFKPSNVLVGEDGRVRVMDFGLARAVGADPLDPSRSASGQRASNPNLTQAGTVLGTPTYMAPEQHYAEPVDARTDLYAFCAAMFAALYRVPPFRNTDFDALAEEKREGRVAETPDRGVPPAIRRLLVAGLSPAPHLRPDSMHALLAGLERAGQPSRHRAWLAAGGLASVAALGLIYGHAREDHTCDPHDSRLAATWNDEVRAEVRGALVGTDAGFAEATADAVDGALDRYAATWSAAYLDACEATAVRDEQSTEVMDLRMACLHRRLDATASVIDVLRSADTAVAIKAMDVVTTLPSLERCADTAGLLAGLEAPPDVTTRAQVERIRRDITALETRAHAGRRDGVVEEAERLLEEARATGYRPLVVEAMATRGRALEHAGEFDAASASLVDALHEGRALGHDDEVLAILVRLVYVDGFRRHQPAEAERWARSAAAELERQDKRGTLEEASFHAQRSTLAQRNGDLAGAVADAQRALEIREAQLPADDLRVAQSHATLGTMLFVSEQPEAARPHLERALEIQKAKVGADHPSVGVTLVSLGGVAFQLHDLDQAEALQRRALEIDIQSLGSDHADTASTRNHLATTLGQVGKTKEAIEQFEEALRVYRAISGPTHPITAAILNNLGTVHWAAGDIEPARRRYQEALDIVVETQGEDHPSVADYGVNVAMAFARQDRWSEALPHYERAARIWEKNLGPDHPTTKVWGYSALGNALLHLDRADEALVVLEKAVAGELPAHLGASDAAGPRLRLAKALWATDGDKRRALALAHEARDALADSPADAESLAGVDRWIAEHQP